jgi:hypothetical protein
VREAACIGVATMPPPWTLRLILNAAALAAASPTLLFRPPPFHHSVPFLDTNHLLSLCLASTARRFACLPLGLVKFLFGLASPPRRPPAFAVLARCLIEAVFIQVTSESPKAIAAITSRRRSLSRPSTVTVQIWRCFRAPVCATGRSPIEGDIALKA